MNDRTVTVFGGTGFLGSRVVLHLRKRGFSVRIASRHPDRGHRLFALDDPQLQSVAANIHDERSVADGLAGAYGVVNAASRAPRRSFPMACCCPWSRFSSCCLVGGKAEIWCSVVMSALRIIERITSDGQDVQGWRTCELEFGSRAGARKNSQSA